jgi:pilus assembly protein CpaE
VFVSPIAALDSRLTSLGEATVRRWQPEWPSLAPAEVITALGADDPQIVVVGPGVEGDAAIAWIQALETRRPDVAIVLVADSSSDLLLHALRAGVADVIPPTVTQAELVAALERAKGRVRRQEPAPLAPLPHVHKRVLAVLSPKGGTGKTMIATSLAVALSERLDDGDVGLVDLDVHFGGAASVLGLLAEHTLGDAARAARHHLEAATLKVFLERHGSGAYVLAAPVSLVEAEEIEIDQTKVVLSLFADLFDWTVVDTSAGIGEHTLMALEFATDLLFVTTPDVAAVRALRRSIEALEMVGMLNVPKHLVVNQFVARAALSVAEIESIVGIPVSGTVPPSSLVMNAMDHGRSILEGSPKDAAVRALRGLVDLYVGAADSDAKAGRRRRKGR